MESLNQTPVKKVEELQGFRAPTADEVKGISRIFEKYYASTNQICKIVTIVLGIVGVLFILAFRPILGLIACAIAILSFVTLKQNDANTKVFNDGNFLVLDGSVCEIGASDTPGRIAVKFQSAYSEKLEGSLRVRTEGAAIGSPLLLVWAAPPQVKRNVVWAFTPFMLTEEAAHLHW